MSDAADHQPDAEERARDLLRPRTHAELDALPKLTEEDILRALEAGRKAVDSRRWGGPPMSNVRFR